MIIWLTGLSGSGKTTFAKLVLKEIKKKYKKFYTNDKYGGHLSINGNKIVSLLLYKYLKKKNIL